MAARKSGDERFDRVEEQLSAIMRFPDDKLATFTVGFDATATASTRSSARRASCASIPAYEYEGALELELTVGDKKPKKKKLKARDQIGAEIGYFSECILKGKEPEPGGVEGMADVRVIRAIYRSIDEGHPVRMEPIKSSSGRRWRRSARSRRSGPSRR